MTAFVRKARSAKKAKTPSWAGSRMPLSIELAQIIKFQLDNFKENKEIPDEIVRLAPVLILQNDRSHLPSSKELLIEKIHTKFGFHYFIYTFEGRTINEGIASLLAFRISKTMKITFSIAMNDYGFELLSDKNVELSEKNFYEILSPLNVQNDLFESLNSIELGKRKFRDIARIVGLINTGYPGENRTMRSLQISSELLFDVFSEFDKDNLLIKQAYDEVLQDQLEGERIKAILKEIQSKTIIIKKTQKVTPFLLPILVDGLRDQVSSESLEEVVERLISN
jgi:ATP-dependent Lhr-like helicase